MSNKKEIKFQFDIFFSKTKKGKNVKQFNIFVFNIFRRLAAKLKKHSLLLYLFVQNNFLSLT